MKQYAKVTPEGSRDLLFEECDDRPLPVFTMFVMPSHLFSSIHLKDLL